MEGSGGSGSWKKPDRVTFFAIYQWCPLLEEFILTNCKQHPYHSALWVHKHMTSTRHDMQRDVIRWLILTPKFPETKRPCYESRWQNHWHIMGRFTCIGPEASKVKAHDMWRDRQLHLVHSLLVHHACNLQWYGLSTNQRLVGWSLRLQASPQRKLACDTCSDSSRHQQSLLIVW